jgi:hypothetical protein
MRIQVYEARSQKYIRGAIFRYDGSVEAFSTLDPSQPRFRKRNHAKPSQLGNVRFAPSVPATIGLKKAARRCWSGNSSQHPSRREMMTTIAIQIPTEKAVSSSCKVFVLLMPILLFDHQSRGGDRS